MSTCCPGCSRDFSFSGMAKHLAQTKNPACHAANTSALDDEVGRAPLADPEIPDLDAPAVAFDGDFFGPYNADDFPEQDDGDDDFVSSNGSSSSSSSDSESEDGLDDITTSAGWEPAPRPVPPEAPRADRSDAPACPYIPSPAEREAAARSTQSQTYIVQFPQTTAGAPVSQAERMASEYQRYQAELSGDRPSLNPYYPFASKTDWEIGHWAKTRGPGSTSFSELLAIEGVAEKLALSYKNSRELNAIVDKLPSARPSFERHEIVLAGEAFEVYYRDILECVKALLGDPEFAPLLLLVPERHYADANHTVRVYFDMNTGKWWWATQTALEKECPGATVIPIIISSDKTQLTLIGNKSAYPVYMTLGNLPKDIRCKPSRRGQILLAYLPTSRLLHITVKEARRRTLANLFHACMSRVLAPLSSTGISGMYFSSGDGVVRRGHPILATYVGDYPEQLLVTCCKNGECPKCKVPRNDLGDAADTSRPLRDLGEVLDALAALDEGSLAFTRACREIGIKAIQDPFWENLPYTNIFVAITPDVLHQLYQGVVKHLVAWLQLAYGPDEMDARCRRLPPNHSLRQFTKGISSLSRLTGKEHQDISRILLGLIIGLRLPNGMSPARLVRATRSLLDFLYLAQYPCHSSKTLKLLDEALLAFHANKAVFSDLQIRENFRLPKLHFLEHYRRCIELYGTTDNYDTQYSERLHIDFTKEAYRASNRKDEFAQMTRWLERKEKILHHQKYVEWCLRQVQSPALSMPQSRVQAEGSSLPSTGSDPTGVATVIRPLHTIRTPLLNEQPRIRMSRHPSVKAVSLDDVFSKYGATYFRDALARFVAALNDPSLSENQVELASGGVYLPFNKVPVYHKIRFALKDIDGFGVTHYNAQDVAHVRPARVAKYGAAVAGRFDTVLVRAGESVPERMTIQGYRVGQVRLVFTIPQKAMDSLFVRLAPATRPRHLAYVEWFMPSSPVAHPDHGLYKLTRLVRNGQRLSSIIPVEQIERTCHLLPDFGPVAPRAWTASTVLEECSTFWLNTFVDRYTYMIIH
ncbi:hypothetical protein NUW54_g3348 [Trametes sanguinea]|uniref:Uncharacterized protein n=1 Tax=Trametes sanguinea TaxID=158606 RepID=A0ACC1Q2N8_9APHY|nr:hypothetical protein NUW54_g3348 [Trametes sanguinea]